MYTEVSNETLDELNRNIRRFAAGEGWAGPWDASAYAFAYWRLLWMPCLWYL